MNSLKKPFPPFSDLDSSLFRTFESDFLLFFTSQEDPPSKESFNKELFHSFRKRIFREVNFAERGHKALQNILFSLLTKPIREAIMNNTKENEEIKEIPYKDQFELSNNMKEACYNRRKGIRANSFKKYDFKKIFQYAYYNKSLRRMKKNSFFNLLTVLERLNAVFSLAFPFVIEKSQLIPYYDKLVRNNIYFTCFYLFSYI